MEKNEQLISEDNSFDTIILGGGPAGYVAAIRASQLGLKTAIVENENIGGMCLNWGCIPSKTLLHSAEIFNQSLNSSKYGIILSSEPKADMGIIKSRINEVVSKLTKGVQILLEKNNVKIFHGFGSAGEPAQIIVSLKKENSENQSRTILHYKHLVIATGSHYEIPDFLKDRKEVYTPKSIFSMDKLPTTLTIIGAGVVGYEFAMIFSLFGVKVNLVDKKQELLPYMDTDLRRMARIQIKKNGINLLNGMHPSGYKENTLLLVPEEQKKETKGKNFPDKKEIELKQDVILIATRRKGNLSGLENLIGKGMEISGDYIKTDDRMRTSLTDIYAVGDVNGRFMLAHAASKEGKTAVETIAGTGKPLAYDFLPYNLYAPLEFASIGLTEKQAEEKGFIIKTAKFPFSANGKALASDQADGFLKIIYDTRYGEILGVHIASANATDLISEAGLAMISEASIREVAATVHPHPTLSEAFMETALKGLDRPIHTL